MRELLTINHRGAALESVSGEMVVSPFRSTRHSGTRPGFSYMQSVLKIIGTLHGRLYRWSGGRIGGKLRGGPVLLLTTIGRRTQQERTWPLCYLAIEDDLVLIASAAGKPQHPAWYLNLRTNPRVEVRLRNGTHSMVAQTARGADRARLWERAVQQYPVVTTYQSKTDREIPVPPGADRTAARRGGRPGGRGASGAAGTGSGSPRQVRPTNGDRYRYGWAPIANHGRLVTLYSAGPGPGEPPYGCWSSFRVDPPQ